MDSFEHLLIYCAVPGLSCCTCIFDLSCGMGWGRVPWAGIKPRPLHWEPGVCVRGPAGQSHSGLFKPMVMLKLCCHSENDPRLTAYRKINPKWINGQGSEYGKEEEKEEGAGAEMGGREGRGAAEKNTSECSLDLSVGEKLSSCDSERATREESLKNATVQFFSFSQRKTL